MSGGVAGARGSLWGKGKRRQHHTKDLAHVVSPQFLAQDLVTRSANKEKKARGRKEKKKQVLSLDEHL